MKKYNKKNKYFNINNWIKIILPKKIDLSGRYRNHLLNNIRQIIDAVKRGEKDILLDFGNATDIIATGMIVLCAEIKNIINYDSSIRFKCYNLKTNKIKQIVKQIKLLSLCKQNINVKLNRIDVINWKVCSGNALISHKFDEVVLQGSVFNELPPQSDLYAGCVEATMNVMRHAYIENIRDIPVSLEKETWWCFTQIKDKRLHMVVCDLGVSIPYTLPKNKLKLIRIIKIFVRNKATDADLLEGAIGSPTSRSKESYRGNGLPKIAEIARIKSGSLSIYSRKGHVHYEGEQTKPITHDHKTPFLGTVIAWTLPLKGDKNENNINSK